MAVGRLVQVVVLAVALVANGRKILLQVFLILVERQLLVKEIMAVIHKHQLPKDKKMVAEVAVLVQ